MRRTMYVTWLAVAGLIGYAGCKVDLPEFVPGGEIDGGVEPDAIACEPSSEVCDDASGIYVACDADGQVDVTMTCPLGCAAGVEKCVDVEPSNGLGEYLDLSEDAGTRVVAALDTDTGVCLGPEGEDADCASFKLEGITVFVFDAVTIQCEGGLGCRVPVTGTNALAIVANEDVLVLGAIDISATGPSPGPGSLTLTDGDPALPSDATGAAGHGGGGHDLGGGAGGASAAGEPAGEPGSSQVDTAMEPLVGGMRGGGSLDGLRAPGGGGGGAVQIVSRTRITLTSGGTIDASGGGGGVGGAGKGGGGGGAGGAILLEAPIVVLDGPAVVLSTKGGGGGSSGAGMPGDDGGTGAGPAGGGVGPGSEPSGGAGGSVENASIIDPSPGGSGVVAGTGGGGGGGSSGRVRFHTAVDVTVANSAAIRSTAAYAPLPTRLRP